MIRELRILSRVFCFVETKWVWSKENCCLERISNGFFYFSTPFHTTPTTFIIVAVPLCLLVVPSRNIFSAGVPFAHCQYGGRCSLQNLTWVPYAGIVILELSGSSAKKPVHQGVPLGWVSLSLSLFLFLSLCLRNLVGRLWNREPRNSSRLKPLLVKITRYPPQILFFFSSLVLLKGKLDPLTCMYGKSLEINIDYN